MPSLRQPKEDVIWLLNSFWQSLRGQLRSLLSVEPFSFTALLAFGAFLLCLLTCMPLTCCCTRRKHSTRRVTVSASKHKLGTSPDQTEVLTPLVVPAKKNISQGNVQGRVSRELLLKRHNIRPADESPPPPRRSNGGRTLIVPLSGSNNRFSRPSNAPLVGTPDSRVTSFEAGTTKSCATIPEDDELELDEEINYQRQNHRKYNYDFHDDLVSIDRTYISANENKSNIIQRPNYSIQITEKPPEFKYLPPSYAPPTPPKTETVHSTPAKRSAVNDHTYGQSNLSSFSPEMSSCGFGSMMETTGSGSFAVPMDAVDERRIYYNDGEKMVITELDESSADTHLRNAILHRIEEESQFEDPSCISKFIGTPSGVGQNKYPSTSFHRIPRSISQQLELMNGRG